MTRIFLSKSGVSPYPVLEIHAGKIDENISKNLISWPELFFKGNYPPVNQVRRNAFDMLDVTREFTITGQLDTRSTCTSATANGNVKTTAMAARDTLINMLRSGGELKLIYGLSSEVTGTGYSPSTLNLYYRPEGFTVHITRITIQEVPKGGSDENYPTTALMHAPELFEVVVVCELLEDYE